MSLLRDKTVVITGAASGIGRATALRVAQDGARLAIVDLNQEGLQATAREALHAGAAEARTFLTDVSDPDAVEELANTVADELRGADVLINNAGINVTASFRDHSLEDFHRNIDVNLYGVVHGCHFFLPQLLDKPQAWIVNISSIFGIVGTSQQTAYCASKFAVRGFTESLHEELADDNVDVIVVHPGCIRTNIVNQARFSDPGLADRSRQYFQRRGADPDVVARKIYAAIEDGRHRVLVTPEAHLLDLARRLLPEAGNRLANRVMGRIIGF